MQYWAKQHPIQLLQSLNKVWKERDAAFSYTKEWNTMVDMFDRANTAAMAAQHQKKKAQKNVRDLKSRNVELEDQNSCLEDCIFQLKITFSPKQKQASSSTLSAFENCNPKVLDPPLYCKIDSDIEIKDWTQQIRNKLTVNKNHLEDNSAGTIYVISCTKSTAAQYIQAYRINNFDHFF